MAETKIGAGSLQAMGRLGLQELRNAAYAGSNVAAPTEKGMYGTAMPSDVNEQRGAEPMSESWLADAAQTGPAQSTVSQTRSTLEAASPTPVNAVSAAPVSPPAQETTPTTPTPSIPAPQATSTQPSTTPGLDALRAPAQGPSTPAPEREPPEMERE